MNFTIHAVNGRKTPCPHAVSNFHPEQACTEKTACITMGCSPGARSAAGPIFLLRQCRTGQKTLLRPAKNKSTIPGKRQDALRYMSSTFPAPSASFGKRGNKRKTTLPCALTFFDTTKMRIIRNGWAVKTIAFDAMGDAARPFFPACVPAWPRSRILPDTWRRLPATVQKSCGIRP